jgi:hypothetical protein
MKIYLYKLYDADSNFLYVGITNNLDQRFTAHESTKAWWPDVEEFVIKRYDTRFEAENAERLCILFEHPQYNELVTTKPYVKREVPEKRYPTTHAKLPSDEVQYLRTLDGEDMLLRAAELQAAGWSVATILEGARVVPTSVYLRIALKSIYNANTGVPVPEPPKSRRIQIEERLSKIKHLTDEQALELKYYAGLAKKFRPQYRGDHPIAVASQAYKDLINSYHQSGVSVPEMAKAVGCNEGNIRRRIIK